MNRRDFAGEGKSWETTGPLCGRFLGLGFNVRQLRPESCAILHTFSYIFDASRRRSGYEALTTASGSGCRERAFTSQARPQRRSAEIPYQLGSNSYQAKP
jgi:hypothetical protein